MANLEIPEDEDENIPILPSNTLAHYYAALANPIPGLVSSRVRRAEPSIKEPSKKRVKLSNLEVIESAHQNNCGCKKQCLSQVSSGDFFSYRNQYALSDERKRSELLLQFIRMARNPEKRKWEYSYKGAELCFKGALTLFDCSKAKWSSVYQIFKQRGYIISLRMVSI